MDGVFDRNRTFSNLEPLLMSYIPDKKLIELNKQFELSPVRATKMLARADSNAILFGSKSAQLGIAKSALIRLKLAFAPLSGSNSAQLGDH